jgi:hypothetical protein
MEPIEKTKLVTRCHQCTGALHTPCFNLISSKRTPGFLCPYCRHEFNPLRQSPPGPADTPDRFLEPPLKKQKLSTEDEEDISASTTALQTPLAAPTVVRLKRTREKVVQDCDVYIGRRLCMGGWNLQQSKWANPFSIKECGSADVAVDKYRTYILKREDLLAQLPELGGRILGCWYAVAVESSMTMMLPFLKL